MKKWMMFSFMIILISLIILNDGGCERACDPPCPSGEVCEDGDCVDACINCVDSGKKCCKDENGKFLSCIEKTETCPCYEELETVCSRVVEGKEGTIDECCSNGCCGEGTSQGCKKDGMNCCPSKSFVNQCPSGTDCCGDDVNGWQCCESGKICTDNKLSGSGKICCPPENVLLGGGCCMIEDFKCGTDCCDPSLCREDVVLGCCDSGQKACGDNCCNAVQKCCELEDASCKPGLDSCCANGYKECTAVGDSSKIVACAYETTEICCAGGKYSSSLYECCDGSNGVQLCKTKGTYPLQRCEGSVCVDI